MMKYYLLYLSVVMLPARALSQELATFTVQAVSGAGVTPVAVPLDAIPYNTDEGRLALYETTAMQQEVASQVEAGKTPKLWFHFDHREGDKDYVICLVQDDQPESPPFLVQKTDQATIILKNNRPVLYYYHEEVMPPAGVDTIFRRSAFIHPLISPGGAVLTRIQPPDHYHHYGIWNPWTSTTFAYGGREWNVDFWNLGKGEGRVRFGGYVNHEQGPVYAGFRARNEHVFYDGNEEGKERLAINEVWDVRVWNTASDDVYIVDLSTVINSPLSGGIHFNQYRYGGGLGFRAREGWTRHNSRVLTSEGDHRAQTDDSKARWCIIEGETEVEQGLSGVVFLSHPGNRMHPEPMRMWDEQAAGGRGEIFFQFTPIRHQGWTIKPGKSYALNYRMVVYDGQISSEKAWEYWKAFATAPVIRFHPR